MDYMDYMDSTMLVILDHPQLFLDNLMVEASHDLTKTTHQPSRDPVNPLIRKDRPWEHVPYFTCSNHVVLRDARDGIFKCWYEDLIDHSGRTYLVEARQCYAESEDGLHWEKPELDVHEEDGRRTNVVLGGGGGTEHAHSCGVVEDLHPPDESKRFRAIFSHYPPFEGQIRAARSPDGIHWRLEEQPVAFGNLGRTMGDASILDYDPDSRTFIVTCRHRYQCGPALNPRHPAGPTNPGPRYPHDFAKQNRRRIWQAESADMVHWSQPHLVLRADDEEDNIDDGFYAMAQCAYAGIYLGFLSVFHRTSNRMDVQLVFSRDRRRWIRANRRQPWLKTGDEGCWDQGMVAASSAIQEVGDELFFFYGGAFCHHDYWIWGPREGMDHPEIADPGLVRFGLGLARLRKHGFVSFDAGPMREGMLVTRPFLSEGERLVINARCGANGYVRVEALDARDEVLADRGREQCDVFTGDDTAHTVTWNGDAALPVARMEVGGDTMFPWKSQPPHRKLRFYMKDAELYSFRVV
ncbi:MAG: hypothetical protein CMJ18_12035 [Phycisphaeraceae bacterium]|nr:hypothetical protein [Phycisphaeraceae bacterium]